MIHYIDDMEAIGIDPRIATAEVPDPRFWVIFWEASGASDEWEVSDCDVDEAICWAESRAAGREYGLWVVFDDGSDVTTVRLKGTDPNDVDPACG